MTATLVVPVHPSTIKLLPAAGEPRPRYVYAGGVRTEAPKVDAAGLPLFGFSAMAQFNGADLGQIQVESPAAQLPKGVGFGTVLVPTGDAAILRISNARDGFDLRVSLTVEGIATS